METKFWIGSLDCYDLMALVRVTSAEIGRAIGDAKPAAKFASWLHDIAMAEYRRRQRCDAGQSERAAKSILPRFQGAELCDALTLCTDLSYVTLTTPLAVMVDELVILLHEQVREALTGETHD